MDKLNKEMLEALVDAITCLRYDCHVADGDTAWYTDVLSKGDAVVSKARASEIKHADDIDGRGI